MTEKLYYWAENLEDYSSDNKQDYDQIIEIKRLNFFIGKNNAGKSRFLRELFLSKYRIHDYNNLDVKQFYTKIYPIIKSINPTSIGKKIYSEELTNLSY